MSTELKGEGGSPTAAVYCSTGDQKLWLKRFNKSRTADKLHLYRTS